MELRKFNNKVVRITDIDNQTLEGLCLYEDKDVYDEELDGLSIKSGPDGQNSLKMKSRKLKL